MELQQLTHPRACLKYAVESQIRHHDLDPSTALILIHPPDPSLPILPTSHILSIISAHASTTALILLPGVQYYTAQYLDIPTITAHAHALGLTIGWDLAHAVGNVPLHLHAWDVDFAVWCNYKYMNAGPGAVAGLFLHSRHGEVDLDRLQNDDQNDNDSSSSSSKIISDKRRSSPAYRPRLSGWWGGDKRVRFRMDNSLCSFPLYFPSPF